MHKKSGALTFFLMLLWLALYYTYPLNKNNTKWKSTHNSNAEYVNNSWNWNNIIYRNSIVERSKKMANDIENAIKKIKKSAQNIYRDNSSKARHNNLTEKDLRQYEQLVIMKKNPYLDLKELELKLRPSLHVNMRQSLFQPEANFHNDLSLYEPEEINVEINNRGLSGFSIPPKLIKTSALVDIKLKANQKDKPDDNVKLTKKYSINNSLESLEKDIVEYERKKNKI